MMGRLCFGGATNGCGRRAAWRHCARYHMNENYVKRTRLSLSCSENGKVPISLSLSLSLYLDPPSLNKYSSGAAAERGKHAKNDTCHLYCSLELWAAWLTEKTLASQSEPIAESMPCTTATFLPTSFAKAFHSFVEVMPWLSRTSLLPARIA